MKILKFGGSSLADADCIRRVTTIVGEARGEGPVAVVVSAFGGVTNTLLATAESASRREDEYLDRWSAFSARHQGTVRDLAPPAAEALLASVDQKLEDLKDLLQGVLLLREASPRTLDAVLSYGERLSSEIVAAGLRGAGLPARACDARRLIVTDDAFGSAQVDLEASYEKIRAELGDDADIAVVTGFVAATADGQTTTLGRGGSDYTAALLGAAVDADAIELWSDVDGMMSADPRLVAEAFPQPRLSYAELMELSHFGAEVVYPPTIHPARSRRIPLWIKNTFNPTAPGTRVTEEAPPGKHPIRGISAVNQVTLMRLEGDGMVGVPGIAQRLFGALARRDVSVILISQSSSEHSICFAVSPGDTQAARAAVERELALERQAGIVDELIIEADQSVIAAVGEQMRGRPGLAGQLFGVLGRHGVNVRAIAQGSAELNLSLVVDRADQATALNAIHGAFFSPRRRQVTLAVAGVGQVGSALLSQLRSAAGELALKEELEIKVVGVCNSRRMLLDSSGVELDDWRQRLDEGEALDADRLYGLLRESAGTRRILVDCTASEDLGLGYGGLLHAGVSVVAANKVPFSAASSLYRHLLDAAERGGANLLHEATVGAGLPVLSTLGDLIRSGDRIERIDGVLSGTVNAVLDLLAAGETLSQAVRAAHAAGLTEPHPWDDLSGRDVARKLCILSRLAGRELELSDVEVEPVITSGDWSTMDLETFWDRLPEVDGDFQRRRDEAATAGHRLRYVASLDDEGARVTLAAVPPDHPAHGLAGADNLVAFTTARYRQSPLVLLGPGAGPEVTAAGVFADILRAADRGAP